MSSVNPKIPEWRRTKIGLLEYLSQSNHSADSVPEKERFKCVDDLTILEIVNLLTIGLSSYSIEGHIPSHIPIHNQYISATNLNSQENLNKINNWTSKQKMKINEKNAKQ